MADPNTSGEKPAPKIIDSSVDSSNPQKYEPQVSIGEGGAGQVNFMRGVENAQPREVQMQIPQDQKPGLLRRLTEIFRRPKTQSSSTSTVNAEPRNTDPQGGMDRRRFLKIGAAAVAGGAIGTAASKPVGQILEAAAQRKSNIGVPPGEFMGDKNPRVQVQQRDTNLTKPKP